MKPALERSLGLGSAISVVTGGVIGSAIFLVATDISKQLPSPWVALSVWVVAGLFSLLGGLVFAELGAKFPRAGGQYVYMKEAFGPLLGFLFAWTHTLILLPGTLAGLAVAVATFSGAFFPMSPFEKSMLATVTLLGLTVVNLLGLKKAAQLLDFLTVVRVFALIAIVVGAFLFFRLPEGAVSSFSAPVTGDWKWSQYGIALIAAFWAYEGWNGVAQVASEVKEPKRNIPMGTIVGILIPMALYVLVNASFMRVMSVEQIQKSTFAGNDSAILLWGARGAIVIAIMTVLSTLGCLNATVITGARVIYASAADKLFPKFLAYVHPKFKVPSAALVIQMVLATVLIWSGTYDQLFTYVICAAFLYYGLCTLALMVIRRREQKRLAQASDSFKVPFYPLLPIVYLIFILLFVANSFVEKPFESLIGFAIVLAGIPFFYLARFQKADLGDQDLLQPSQG